MTKKTGLKNVKKNSLIWSTYNKNKEHNQIKFIGMLDIIKKSSEISSIS